MKLRRLLLLGMTAGLPVLGGGSRAAAQSAEVLEVTRWNLSFSYTAQSSVEVDGQSYEYGVSVSGDAVLEPNDENSTGRSFRGDPALNVTLTYDGSVVDSEGCGLAETLVGHGVTECDYPSTLYLDEETFDVDFGCSTVPVTHAFEWLGACGELFPYPDQEITTWSWLAQDYVADGSAMLTTFDYPASGATLEGADSGEPISLLAPLFTALSSGTGAPLSYSFDFTLTPAEEQELELEVTSAAYPTWRPSAGGVDRPGEPLEVTAELKTPGGGVPNVRVVEFIWELTGTSREPGIAMNYPIDATDDELDLRLEGVSSESHVVGPDGQKAERVDPEGFTDRISVVPYDWGGWSELSVTAVLAGGKRVTGRLAGGEEGPLRLPRRAVTSFIADDWKDAEGVSGPDDADDEGAPEGDGTPGDGLSLYQEYRGFYEDGAHIVGSPTAKDLFIRNRAGAASTAGIQLFRIRSGLNVHELLTARELPATRVINANRAEGPSVTDQHALIIQVMAGQTGFAEAVGGPGNPKRIERIALMSDWATLDGNYLAAVVAHELFHSVNVYHHGEADEEVTWGPNQQGVLVESPTSGGAATPITVLTEDGRDATEIFRTRIAHDERLPLYIGVDQGQHSGSHSCVMRYNNAQAYVSDEDLTVRYFVSEMKGNQLCQGPTGTDVNDEDHEPQSRYGDAAEGRGSCAKQPLVTDAVDAPER